MSPLPETPNADSTEGRLKAGSSGRDNDGDRDVLDVCGIANHKMNTVRYKKFQVQEEQEY